MRVAARRERARNEALGASGCCGRNTQVQIVLLHVMAPYRYAVIAEDCVRVMYVDHGVRIVRHGICTMHYT
jgi:hypothetical protein